MVLLVDSTVAETRAVPGWPGYLVTDDGRVFSQWVRAEKGTKGLISKVDPAVFRELRLFDRSKRRENRGYLSVRLRGGGRSRVFFVHVLVLLAFKGPRPDGHETRHLNGRRDDNRLSNLAWGTHQENEADRRRHGTVLVGELHGQARFTSDQVLEIRRRLAKGEGPTAIGRAFGVSKTAIAFIRDGKNWRHVA